MLEHRYRAYRGSVESSSESSDEVAHLRTFENSESVGDAVMETSDPRKDAIPFNSTGVAFSDSSCFSDDDPSDSADCRSGSDMVYCVYVYRIYMSSLS